MGTETMIAHCGACASLMILITDDPAGYWYCCRKCGETTDPRPTTATAAEDVVWVPAQPNRKRQTKGATHERA